MHLPFPTTPGKPLEAEKESRDGRASGDNAVAGRPLLLSPFLVAPGPLPALRPSPRCATFPPMKLLHPSRLRAVAFLLAAVSPVLSPADPKLVCEAPTHDFGEAVSPSIVEHDYILRNDGDTSLEILSVRASCGCTAVNASQNIVPPGQTASIHARLDLAGRTGLQMKTISVTSNDPQSPSLQLVLRGTAVPPFSLNPPALYFGRLDSAEGRVRTLELTARDPVSLVSASLGNATPGLLVELLPPAGSPPALSHLVRVTVSDDVPHGAFSDNILLETTSPLQPSLSITVTGYRAFPGAAP